MQTSDSEGNVGSREGGDDHETGLLEGPNRVVFGIFPCLTTVYTGGVAVATLGGDHLVTTIESEDPKFKATVHDFSSLNWTHRGAMLRAQGEQVVNILGPSMVLLRGKHRPIYDPRPGMNDARVVVPDLDSMELGAFEIFRLVKQRGF